MTTQTAIVDGLPTGLSLSAKLFDVDVPDTEVTGNTFGIVEGTNAKSRYVVTITRATALPARDYDIRLFVGSVPIAVGTFRFAGTDGETAVEVPATVELDSATQAVLADIPTNAELTAALSGLATQSYIDSVLSTYVIEAF